MRLIPLATSAAVAIAFVAPSEAGAGPAASVYAEFSSPTAPAAETQCAVERWCKQGRCRVHRHRNRVHRHCK